MMSGSLESGSLDSEPADSNFIICVVWIDVDIDENTKKKRFFHSVR